MRRLLNLLPRLSTTSQKSRGLVNDSSTKLKPPPRSPENFQRWAHLSNSAPGASFQRSFHFPLFTAFTQPRSSSSQWLQMHENQDTGAIERVTQQLEQSVFANCQSLRGGGFYSTWMNSVNQQFAMRSGQPIPPELPPVPGQAPAEQEPGMPPRPPEPAPFEPAPPDPEPSTVPAPKA